MSNTSEAHRRGENDATQDFYENVPFASIGGIQNRGNMKAPSYIPAADVDDYLEGYRVRATQLYGDDWEDVEFTWRPALKIPKGSSRNEWCPWLQLPEETKRHAEDTEPKSDLET